MMHAGVIAISQGGWHSMVLTEGGSVWVLGNNLKGQLGLDGLERVRVHSIYEEVVSSGQCGTTV